MGVTREKREMKCVSTVHNFTVLLIILKRVLGVKAKGCSRGRLLRHVVCTFRVPLFFFVDKVIDCGGARM